MAFYVFAFAGDSIVYVSCNKKINSLHKRRAV